MRLPRDLSGADMVKLLEHFSYRVTRQTGSHLRLSRQSNGEHHVTIPKHDPLRVGTLGMISESVAAHFNMSREELLRCLPA